MPRIDCKYCKKTNVVDFSKKRSRHDKFEREDETGEFVEFTCFRCGETDWVSTLRYQLMEEMG